MRCWKTVNHLGLIALPDEGEVVKERVQIPKSWHLAQPNTATALEQTPDAFIVRAECVLQRIKQRITDKLTLGEVWKAGIQRFQNGNQQSIWVECDTNERWKDIPVKPSGTAEYRGTIKIAVYQNQSPPAWTPLWGPQGCYMHRTTWQTDTLDTCVVIFSVTGDPKAHDRLAAIVREELEKEGIMVNSEPKPKQSVNGE